MASKKKYNNEEGVWRTIGGRRVFIKTGQSLSSAMRDSGKFKRRKETKEFYRKEDEELRKLEEQANKDYEKEFTRARELGNDKLELEAKEKRKQRLKDLGNARLEVKRDLEERLSGKEYISDYPEAYRHYERDWESTQDFNDDIFLREEFKVGKASYPDEKDYMPGGKRWNPEWASARESKVSQEGLNKLKHPKGLKTWDSVEQRYKKSQSNDNFEVGDLKRKALEEVEKRYGKEERNKVENALADIENQKVKQKQYEEKYDTIIHDDGYVESVYKNPDVQKEVALSTAKAFGSKEVTVGGEKYVMNNKGDYELEKTGNDYLPKASKVETAGTSNRKEVSDNIQAHILEYYDNPVDFMEQMDAMDWLPTKWHAGQEMARQGFYDIYYDDQREFLESLNINPKGKEFSDDRVFQTYNSLIGRESERLYNRLEKLYEQYKKEHKGSDVSLDDFRKWFK